MPLSTLTEDFTNSKFLELLKNNPGLIIAKFGAEWCGPCKKIEDMVLRCFSQMPDNVQPVIIDVDESFELYAFLKSKKMVKAIPTILCYEKGNLSYVPNDAIVGADVDQVNLFFTRCFNSAKSMIV
jgi:thioredoxin 1